MGGIKNIETESSLCFVNFSLDQAVFCFLFSLDRIVTLLHASGNLLVQ